MICVLSWKSTWVRWGDYLHDAVAETEHDGMFGLHPLLQVDHGLVLL